MTRKNRTILAAAIVVFGVCLMFGGIFTDKSGALVVGICVAATGAYRIRSPRNQSGQDGE